MLLTKCHILFHFQRLTSLKMWVKKKGFSCVYPHAKKKIPSPPELIIANVSYSYQLMCRNKEKNTPANRYLDSLLILKVLYRIPLVYKLNTAWCDSNRLLCRYSNGFSMCVNVFIRFKTNFLFVFENFFHLVSTAFVRYKAIHCAFTLILSEGT